jgi:NAD-dependent deacetylase
MGCGISAESSIKTFRDAYRLWEGQDIMQVTSPKGYEVNPELVLDFYNQRRRQLLAVAPNKAHFNLVQLEKNFDIHINTQNVDDLHERSGSSKIIHLHGELLKVRSTANKNLILDWKKDLHLGDLCIYKSQLRPHIVWFGEPVPLLEKAIELVQKVAILIIIGTSMKVYPAASLIRYIKVSTPIYFIDPKPSIADTDFKNLTVITAKAGEGTDQLLNIIKR